MLKTNRLRADTTVVPADVGYPTDSGLMARGVVRLGCLVGKLHGYGLATRTKMRDRSRSARRRAHDIGAWLRRRSEEAKDEVRAVTAEMADIAEESLAEARKVAANARRACTGPVRTPRARPERRWPSWACSLAGWSASSRRPGYGCQARSPKEPPASCPCTTRTPGP